MATKKKQVSDDTQAIIDRLVHEGNLLRNKGDHSLKSVKVDIAKFGDVFKSINNGIGKLNQTVGDMVGRAIIESKSDESRVADIAASFGLSSDYVDLQTKAAEMQVENMEEEARVTKEKLTQDAIDREKSRKDAERNKPGMVGGLFKKINDNKMDLVKYGLLGYAGFQIIRGALDQFTDGGFSEGLSKVGETISNINWSAIGTGLGTFATFLADNPVASLTAGLLLFSGLAGSLPGLVISGIGGSVTAMFANKDNLKVPDGKKFFGGKGKIGFGLAGILLAATAVLLPMLGNWLLGVVGGYTDADFAAAKTDPGIFQMLGGVGQGALAGATIGSFFGPQGMLIGAIMGGVGALLYQGVKYVEREFVNSEETMARQATSAVAKLSETLERRKASEKNLAGTMSDEDLQAKMDRDFGTVEDLQKERVVAEVDLFNKNKINIEENKKRLAELKAKDLFDVAELNPYNGDMSRMSEDVILERKDRRAKRVAMLESKIASGRAVDAELTGTVTPQDIALYDIQQKISALEDGFVNGFAKVFEGRFAEAERDAKLSSLQSQAATAFTNVNVIDNSTKVGDTINQSNVSAPVAIQNNTAGTTTTSARLAQ